MRQNSANKVIGSFKNYIKKIDLEPDYQRNPVWKKEQKQLLIDTIFTGLPIPPIYLRRLNNSEYETEVIDGKQRIIAIREFVENKYKLLDETEFNDESLADKKYKNLSDDEKAQFEDYELVIVELDGTDEEIRKMFERFQNGTSLNAQEIRNAIFSKIKNEVKEIAQHLFFESVAFTNNRLKYDEMAATLMMLEQNKGKNKVKQSDLDFMYNNFSESGLPEVKEKVMRVLDFMQNAFPDKKELENKALLKKTTLTSLYLLVSELIDEYGEIEIDNYINDFSTWFQVFDKEREEQRKLNENEREKDMKKYIELISNNTSSPESIIGRKEILMKKWEGYLKQLEKERKKEQEKESKKSTKQSKNKTDTEKQNETLENATGTVKNNEQDETHQQEISA